MRVSLLDGWLPWALRIGAVLLVMFAAGWGTRRWRIRWLPIAACTAVLGTIAAWLMLPAALGLNDPVPIEAWLWLTALLFAAGVVIVGWRGRPWWRHGVGLVAVLLTCATMVNAVNSEIGYYPTLRDAWLGVSHTRMPTAIELSQLAAVPADTPTGRVVAVTIPATFSHFRHRQEYVYLPPAWFRHPRPHLPVLVMIGGVFAAPDDWIRAGHAVETADAYAQKHSGLAPILVFADATGDVITDTECVNGAAGNAEDHLVKDIPAYVESAFDAAATPRQWGVAGWSMGGTCAVSLVVGHPDTFNHFVDISGDLGPNVGDKQQTIDKLFNGNAAAWAAHDPLTLLAHRGSFHGVTGLFVCGTKEEEHCRDANQLAAAAKLAGIPNDVTVLPGDHTWKFATRAFAAALPWFGVQLDLRRPRTPS